MRGQKGRNFIVKRGRLLCRPEYPGLLAMTIKEIQLPSREGLGVGF
jgi:hypothetical protein